jgi:translation initiation factor 1
VTAKKDEGNPFAKLAGLRDALPVQTPTTTTPPAPAPPPVPPAFAGKIVVRKERAGRGGKTVTLVEGVQLKGDALADFARQMKKALGCGATVEGTAIALQGEHEDRAKAYLEKQGATKVVQGTKR